ncbi:hypothetical protein [Pelistega ratti]|uniref:hypothetical protein n=1 Tax=Pelistega ratti TaxID=2652177 RepID=UPI001916B49E|nr:hypothetical protein [Pelistega ratti]
MSQQSVQNKKTSQLNTQAVKFELDGEAGKRVVLAAARRVIKIHQKEIKALAYK